MAEDHEHEAVEEVEFDAEREARRYVALAQIRQYPDPVLRMQAHDVEVFDDDLKRLAERMTALMEGANGVGLAATQIGVLRRLFVLRPQEPAEATVVVNPQVVERSEEREIDEEGCLSLQGVLVPVERHLAVTVTAKDVTGADLRLELEGFEARACQHEVDHLDGTLVLDRTTDEARREALARLRPRPVLGTHL